MTMTDLRTWKGHDVVDPTGEKIGQIADIYLDEQTDQPEWLAVRTGLFGRRVSFVPLAEAQPSGDDVVVPYAKEQVKDAPEIDSDELSQEAEQELYSYYGLRYSERRSDTGLPEGAPKGGRETGRGTDSLTRAEEELRVGKRETEAGRARIRKWVETEPVTADVELRRETARVEREPINQPVSGAEIGEQEVDVTLRAEEPVVQKETVAKERVGLEKDVRKQKETVKDEVKKERVEVEGDVDERRR